MKKTIFAGIAMLVALAAIAGGTMKPGQYEYTMKMEMPGMPVSMPPQNFRHCLTQSDVDQGKQYQGQQHKDCEVKNLKQSAGKATFDLACKDGTTGSAEYTFTPDGMTGKTTMHSQGRDMTMDMSAKRVGDCK